MHLLETFIIWNECYLFGRGIVANILLKILQIAYIWEEEYSSIYDIRAGRFQKRRTERNLKVGI